MRLSVFSFALLAFALQTHVLASIRGSSFDVPAYSANVCAAATIRADDLVLRSSDSVPAAPPPGEDNAKGDAEDCD